MTEITISAMISGGVGGKTLEAKIESKTSGGNHKRNGLIKLTSLSFVFSAGNSKSSKNGLLVRGSHGDDEGALSLPKRASIDARAASCGWARPLAVQTSTILRFFF